MHVTLLYLITLLLVSMAGTTAEPICPEKCGDVIILYPFGIGTECSLTPSYSLTCNTSSVPHRAYLTNNAQTQNFSENPRSIHEIINITETQLRVRNQVVQLCYDPTTKVQKSEELGMLLPPDSPFAFSATENKVFSVGCGFTSEVHTREKITLARSSSRCDNEEAVKPGKCSANGCSVISIRKGLREYYFYVEIPQLNSISYDRCGYGFIGDENEFKFQGSSDFSDPIKFVNRILQNVSLVVDWAIGNNQTCDEAKANGSSYCKKNTYCNDTDIGTGGYRCTCLLGFHGNPYNSTGCTRNEERCQLFYKNNSNGECVPKFYIKLIIGLGVSFVGLAICISWIHMIIQKHKSIKRKEQLFTKNGGLLLKGQLTSTSPGSGIDPVKIFTEKELKIATNNFSGDNIAGRGGSGVVYKGRLDDQSLIAIKKAIIVDEVQIDQFINELIILSQINHRNVVKLLGCCLEVEVPLLIYEFIPNGALFNHLHNDVHLPWLDWRNCLRIISEIANALAYLHCSANFPIIHRDIKSANILLDENYIAKISDFGASRLIPLDQTKHCTAVQGTLGYLDPEYMFTSQLTEKSDVFSFGVLVAEILTRKKAIFSTTGLVYRNLATYFVESVRKGEVASIMDPQVVESARKKEVTFVAEIVCKCLATKAEDRPTMTDVAAQLDKLANRVLC